MTEERTRELDHLLADLRGMRMRPDQWDEVASTLRTVDRTDDDAVERVSQLLFEARVQRRFQAGRAASTLPPTKQTSALPWVGLVCGAILLAVGGALGGGAVLVGVALLGLFVFGIAMAGSRVAHARPKVERVTSVDPPVPVPGDVDEVIRSLRAG